jgi:hypothetical protein
MGDEAWPEAHPVFGDFDARSQPRLGFVHGYYDNVALLLVQTNVRIT